MLKKQHLLLAILSVLLIIGCNSSDDGTEIIPPPLSFSVTTYGLTSVSSNSAIGGGNVISEDGLTVSERGIVWSKTVDPTIDDFKASGGNGLGAFTANMTNLEPYTSYYVKAYAINSNGVVYGLEIPFTTLAAADTPSITTKVVTDFTNTTASGGGTILTDGLSEIAERGIVWNTNTNPTTDDFKTIDGSGLGEFDSSMTDLTANTLYYVKAYATNDEGTFYGNEVSFTTLTNEPPSITTLEISDIDITTASGGGEISTDGGSDISERGIAWSTTTNPTVDDFKTTDGSGLGAFTSSMTDLIANTTYYVRAYATNNDGVFYGNEISFTTLDYTIQYTIGEIGPGGGFVFQVDASGLHGKEIAPLSTQFQTQWGCPTNSVSGTSSSIGAGQSNSTLILDYHTSIDYYTDPEQCTNVITATGDVAAKNCDDLMYNDATDWYLPSIGELVLVQNNLIDQNLGDFTDTVLVSSTESPDDITMVRVLTTSNGVTSNLDKSNSTDHRAVRDF